MRSKALALKGQASLEYLLVMAAFLSALALVFPPIVFFYHSALFGLDAASAESFLNSLENNVKELSLLGDNSCLELKASPLNKWTMVSNGMEVRLKVYSPFLKKEKIFSKELPSEIIFDPVTINESRIFMVSKESGGIFLFPSGKNTHP